MRVADVAKSVPVRMGLQDLEDVVVHALALLSLVESDVSALTPIVIGCVWRRV